MIISPVRTPTVLGPQSFGGHAFCLLPLAAIRLRDLDAGDPREAEATLAAMFAAELDGFVCAICGLSLREVNQAHALALQDTGYSPLPRVLCLQRPLTQRRQREGKPAQVLLDRLVSTEQLPGYPLMREAGIRGMRALTEELGYVPQICL